MDRAKRLTQVARSLRRRDVPAEALLWRMLRNRQLGEFKFRRQHPVGRYIVDFACVERKVVVELDGDSHAWSQRKDAERTRFLEAEGWHVLRFWNNEVYESLEAVEKTIYQVCEERA